MCPGSLTGINDLSPPAERSPLTPQRPQGEMGGLGRWTVLAEESDCLSLLGALFGPDSPLLSSGGH